MRGEMLRFEERVLGRWNFQGEWVLIMAGVVPQGSLDLLATWHRKLKLAITSTQWFLFFPIPVNLLF
jgi:hypothetical protein